MSQVISRCGLQLIGPFTITVAGRPAQLDLIGKKARALLAYLAMQPQFSERREKLADLLWPNRGDAAARHSLRQCLVTLKKELDGVAPNLLIADARRVALNAEHLTVDLRHLTQLAEQCDAGFDPEFVKFRDGEVLEDLTLASEPFNVWLDERRELIQTQRAKILQTAVAQFSQDGNLAAAINAAERLCKIDAVREDWQRQLLQLYVKRDGRAPALAHARKWLATLKRDFGAEPEAATVALIEQIKDAEDCCGAAPMPDAGVAVDAAVSLVPALPGAAIPAEPVQNSTAVRSEQPLLPGPNLGAGKTAEHWRLAALWQTSSSARVWLTTAVSSTVAVALCAAVILVLASRADDVAANGSVLVDASNYVTIKQPPHTAGDQGSQAAHLCDQLGRQLGRTPHVKILSPSAGRPRAKVASFNLDCDANRANTSIALILTDNVDGVRVWDADLNAPDQFESDPLRRAVREITIGMTQAIDRHPAYAVNESTKLIRQARAAQYRGPTAVNHETALRLYEQALALDSTSRDAMLGVAAELVFTPNNVLRGDRAGLDRAERLLMRVLAEAPNSTMAHQFFGVLQENFGNYDAGIRAFRRALELSPGDPLVYGQLGHALILKGNYQAGLSQTTAALRISPNDIFVPIWCVFAGEAELELGNGPAATEWFLRALTLSPNYVRARGWLAAAYSIDGNPQAAAPLMQEFRRQLQINSMAELKSILSSVPDAGLAGNRPRLLHGLELAAKASGL